MGDEADRFDIHEFRASRKRKTENLLKEDHRDLKRFFALDSAAYRDVPGGLDAKTKELLGLVASTVLRCNDCIAYHVDQCVAVGWKKGELLDALNVALVVGGSITIPHIRTVWETVDQIFSELEAEKAAPARAEKLAKPAAEVTSDLDRKPAESVLNLGLSEKAKRGSAAKRK
jgi:AhpD family alkylhydroperoxidase